MKSKVNNQQGDEISLWVGRFIAMASCYSYFESNFSKLYDESRVDDMLCHDSRYRNRQLLEDLYEISNWFTKNDSSGRPLSNCPATSRDDVAIIALMMRAGYDTRMAEAVNNEMQDIDPVLKKYNDRLHSLALAGELVSAEANYLLTEMRYTAIWADIYMQLDFEPPLTDSNSPTAHQLQRFQSEFAPQIEELIRLSKRAIKHNQKFLQRLNAVEQTERRYGHPRLGVVELLAKWGVDARDQFESKYSWAAADYEWEKLNFITRERLATWLRAVFLYTRLFLKKK